MDEHRLHPFGQRRKNPHTDTLCRHHDARTRGGQSMARHAAREDIVNLRHISPSCALGVTPASSQLADDLLAMATTARINFHSAPRQEDKQTDSPISRPVKTVSHLEYAISRLVISGSQRHSPPCAANDGDMQKGHTRKDAAFSVILEEQLVEVSQLVLRAQNVHNLVLVKFLHIVASRTEVLTRIELCGILCEDATDSSRHSKTGI